MLDGGFSANNPTLYAIADALMALKVPRESIRVVSVGTGNFPEPGKKMSERVRDWGMNKVTGLYNYDLAFFNKTLNINTRTMEALKYVLARDIHTVRIHNSYTEPHLACGFLEHDLSKLDQLYQRGRQSFAEHEKSLREFLTPQNGK
jgi:uncharacterized protein